MAYTPRKSIIAFVCYRQRHVTGRIEGVGVAWGWLPGRSQGGSNNNKPVNKPHETLLSPRTDKRFPQLNCLTKNQNIINLITLKL